MDYLFSGGPMAPTVASSPPVYMDDIYDCTCATLIPLGLLFLYDSGSRVAVTASSKVLGWDCFTPNKHLGICNLIKVAVE